MSKTRRAVEEIRAWIDGEEPESSNEQPAPSPSLEDIKRALTRNATAAKMAGRQRNVQRAHGLRDKGLTPAQIAVKMTQQRGDPQRPAIDRRTVQRWLADKETRAVRRSVRPTAEIPVFQRPVPVVTLIA
jgi:hypothetical protein